MSRSRILAVAGCLAVGGLLAAAAAQLNVTSDNLGAGVSTVVSCDPDGVNVEYTTSWGTNPDIDLTGEFAVTSITVTGIHDDCVGQSLLGGLIDGEGEELGFIIPAEITGNSASGAVVRPVPDESCFDDPDLAWLCFGVSAESLEKIGVLITETVFYGP